MSQESTNVDDRAAVLRRLGRVSLCSIAALASASCAGSDGAVVGAPPSSAAIASTSSVGAVPATSPADTAATADTADTAAAVTSPPSVPPSTGVPVAPADARFGFPEASDIAGEPGSVVWAKPLADEAGVASAWRVLSRTPGLPEGGVSTGQVFVPTGTPPQTGRPIVVYGHAFDGIADVCAWSQSSTLLDDLEYLRRWLAAGFVVASTDFTGWGTPGRYPYLDGPLAGRSMLDAARAARELVDGAGDEVWLYGHSSGAHAALFAGEIASSYAPELDVQGVVALAPPTQIEASLVAAAGVPELQGFTISAVLGLAASHPELDPAEVLTEPALATASAVDDTCLGDVLWSTQQLDLATVLDPAGFASGGWPGVLDAVTPGAEESVPVLAAVGSADPLVPASTASTWQARACAAGTGATLVVVDGADHSTIITDMTDAVLAFTDGVDGARVDLPAAANRSACASG